MTARLTQTAGRLDTALDRRAERSRAQFDRVSGGLSLKGIQRDLGLQRDRLRRATRTASQAGSIQVKSWRDQMEKLDRLRETLGYQATLERGYAVVWDGDKVVTNSTQAKKATSLEVQFKDARIPVGAAAKAAPKPKPSKSGQPGLFDD